MSQLPLITIITVVYNGEMHIEDTILSVIRQSYPRIEYIIIDGGSTDNTLSIIEKYRNHITALISEKDSGISNAFNKGLKLATGEMIGIINADDWYESSAIEKVVSNMDGYDVLHGDIMYWANGKIDFVQTGAHKLLTREMTINHPTVFVRRNCYERFGVFKEDLKYAMDYDIILRFWVNNCRFRHIAGVLANMRWGGTSDVNWKGACREALLIKNTYLSDRKWLNKLYYLKHVLAISIPKFLNRTPFSFLVKIYRSRYSQVGKEYH